MRGQTSLHLAAQNGDLGLEAQRQGRLQETKRELPLPRIGPGLA